MPKILNAIDNNNWSIAMEEAKRLANAGNADGQRVHGFEEFGNNMDPSASIYWFTQAGNNNDSNSQNQLGLFYQEGTNGVKQDLLLAYYWFTRAARNGNSRAMRSLSSLYISVDKGGIPMNVDESYKWGEIYLHFLKTDKKIQKFYGSSYNKALSLAEDWVDSMPFLSDKDKKIIKSIHVKSCLENLVECL